MKDLLIKFNQMSCISSVAIIDDDIRVFVDEKNRSIAYNIVNSEE
jgi:hypothetical protein